MSFSLSAPLPYLRISSFGRELRVALGRAVPHLKSPLIPASPQRSHFLHADLSCSTKLNHKQTQRDSKQWLNAGTHSKQPGGICAWQAVLPRAPKVTLSLLPCAFAGKLLPPRVANAKAEMTGTEGREWNIKYGSIPVPPPLPGGGRTEEVGRHFRADIPPIERVWDSIVPT